MTSGDFESLTLLLRHWDRRRRKQELLRMLPSAALVGLLLSLGVVLLSFARPLWTRSETAQIAIAVIAAVLLVACFFVALRLRDLSERARFADSQFGLRERMITAVEVQSGSLPVNPELASLQLGDALAASRRVDVSRGIPLTLRIKDWTPALAALAVLAVIFWFPNPQEAILLEQRAVEEAVAEQAETLTGLIQEIEANERLPAGRRETLQEPLEEALAALQEPGITRQEAVAAISKAETELRDLGQQMDPPELREALEQAGAALAGSEIAEELAEALQDGRRDQAADALRSLAIKLPGMSSAEQSGLANSLSEVAAMIGETDAALSDALARAAGSLKDGDVTEAVEALGETAALLAASSELADAAREAQATADRLATARQQVAAAGSSPESDESGQATGAGAPGSGQESAGNGGQHAENGGAAGSQNGDQAGAGGPGQGGGHVESIFVPAQPRIEDGGQNLELDVQCLEGVAGCAPVGVQSPITTEGQTTAGGSLVPYDQVFGNYRDAAIEALASGNIPLGLQDLVREYFSALEP